MKDDDTVREEKPRATNALNGTHKDAPHSVPGAPIVTPKKRSSGRGLYITAIVLGVIIVLLLALYIFLTLTYKRPTHTFIVTHTSIAQISVLHS